MRVLAVVFSPADAESRSFCTLAVDGKVLSSIGRGIMVLVGIGTRDTAFELDWLAGKLLNMRLFPDAESDSWGWKKSVMDINGDVLCGEQRLGQRRRARRLCRSRSV